MKKCSELYKKNSHAIENILFPLILLIWPMLRMFSGLSMADTLYSLSNYEFFPEIKGPWMQATYLANALGYFLMKLPGGSTVMGMYFYTSLILSAILLIVYFMMRRTFGAPVTAAGEFIACCLCWCPTTLLYNYLTYMLMTLGIIFLWKGITSDGNKKCHIQDRYFAAAGFCLGLNVMSRMANADEALFIIVLWLSPLIGKNDSRENTAAAGTFHSIFIKTLLCIAGWAVGFLIPYAAICVQYGPQAYGNMISSMFSMTDQATDYKFSSMIAGMFGDYGVGLMWLVPMAACILAILLLGIIIGRKNDKAALMITKVLSVCSVIVWVRFCWGKGMFDYHYYEYRAVYYWAVIFLIMTLVSALACLFGKTYHREMKVFALLLLAEILITPLGSNNQLYPIINNMFLAVPFTFAVCTDYIRNNDLRMKQIPAAYAVCGVILMTVIQSVGFYFGFALQDGVWGDARTAKATASEKTAGIYTTVANAGQIDELYTYADTAGIIGRNVIDYGDIPGVGYLLDMSPALSSFWPSLPSYQYKEWQTDITSVESDMKNSQRPVIITSSGVGAYLDDDDEGMKIFSVDSKTMDKDRKLKDLQRFMKQYGYEETFCNGQFVVYE